MYSVLLIAAMAAPADSAAFGKHHGGCACSGYSCAGYACGGVAPAGYPWGAAMLPSGGCFLGKHGACYGCYGNAGTCHGAGSCYGYAFGGVRTFGFAGCYGSCYGSYTNYFSYWSAPADVHYGYGMPMHIGPPPVMPPPPPPAAIPPAPPAKAPPPAVKPGEKKTSEPKIGTDTNIGQFSAPAKVIVTLPAEAILYANGVRMQQTSAERHFVTPALESGMAYHYVFTIETIRDGRTVSEDREVAVQAGAEIRVNFNAQIDATGIAARE
jgi:uncharacterized protein (TIGR03000 family)